MTEKLKFKEQRERVLERDGYECRFCGVSDGEHRQENGNGLHVHHLVPRGANGGNEVDNLISVCASCHKTLEHTQGDLLKRYNSGKDEKIAELEGRLDELTTQKKRADNWKEDFNQAMDGFQELLSHRLKITIYTVHESDVTTSDLLYVGVDEKKAVERFEGADGHATIETRDIYLKELGELVELEKLDRIDASGGMGLELEHYHGRSRRNCDE